MKFKIGDKARICGNKGEYSSSWLKHCFAIGTEVEIVEPFTKWKGHEAYNIRINGRTSSEVLLAEELEAISNNNKQNNMTLVEKIYAIKDVDLDYIEKHAKYYLLELDKKKAVAILFEATDNDNRQAGFTFSREYEHGKGYYWNFEPTWISAGFCISEYCKSKYDITRNFYMAKNVAYQHTK